MARKPRCLVPEIPCHITQRGVDRRETSSSIDDRHTYIELLRVRSRRVRAHCLIFFRLNLLHRVGTGTEKAGIELLALRV